MDRTLSLSTLPEVQLVAPPLAKVVMQVRYSLTAALTTEAAEFALSELLSRYPVRRRDIGAPMQFLLVPGPPQLGRQETVLQFESADGTWRTSVSESAVSLETSAYENRADFISRCVELFEAVAQVALPPIVDRVGLRYVDRLTGDDLARLPQYVVAPLRGLAGSLAPDLVLQHSITDSVITFDGDSAMQLRSGLLPPQTSFDPLLVGIPEPSWLLDMDAYSLRGGSPFDVAQLRTRLTRYAEAAYSCFRYAMTDTFQTQYKQESSGVSGGTA